MKIYICDDQETHIRLLCNILNEYTLDTKVQMSVYSFLSASDLFVQLSKDDDVDLIFMDIELGGDKNSDGVEIVEKINLIYPGIPVAYISSHTELAPNVFHTHPIGFIIKPFNKYQIFDFLNTEIPLIKKNRYLMIAVARKNYRLDTNEIIYVESKLRKISIHTQNGLTMSMPYHIDKLTNELRSVNTHYSRIHRSYIINFEYVVIYSHYNITLANGIEFPVSRKYAESVRMDYLRYIGVLK